MAYVPQNVNVFIAAFSGALAGMGVSGRVPNDPVIAHYDSLSLIASAYAQAFDLTWGAIVIPTTFEVELIQSESEATWQDRAPQGDATLVAINLNVATYIPLVRALIASIRSGQAYLAGQGIVPPPVGGIVSVTASLPATSSGGANPNIAINPATPGTPGSLSAADKTKLDGIAPGAAVASVTGTAPIASSGGATPNLTFSPTADIAWNAHKITNLLNPTTAQDAATKGYVDAVAQGLQPKSAVIVIATAPIVLAGVQVIDGVPVVIGNRVLVAGQGGNVTVADIANGYYVVGGGAWTRATDLPAGSQAAGVYSFVEEGSTFRDTGWVCSTDPGSDFVGISPLAWVQFSSAGVALPGNGLNKVGNTFNVLPNVDGSIAVGATVAVGVLASDAQHGVRGGGTQHALAVAAGAAGFMSGADKTRLDNILAVTGVGSFTYREGGVAAGSVFTSFAAAYAAAVASGVACQIEIDDSLGAPVVTAGAYDLSQIDLVGTRIPTSGTFSVTLTFGNGVTVSAWRALRYIRCVSTSAASITTYAGGNVPTIWMYTSFFTASGAAAFFHVTAATFLLFRVIDASGLFNSGAPVCNIDGGCFVFAYLFSQAQFGANSVTGAGECDVVLVSTAPISASAVQAGLGTFVLSRMDLAKWMAYDDTVVAIPALGTNVQAVLDALKFTLHGGTASRQAEVDANAINFAGGTTGTSGGARPITNALRDGIQTVDNTPNQVLNSVTPVESQEIRVISEVLAKRTDVVGDAAWFLLRAVYLRSGGLIVVKAPSVVDSGSTAGAASWTAILAANGNAVETQVTGENGKTIHWSLVREYIEDN